MSHAWAINSFVYSVSAIRCVVKYVYYLMGLLGCPSFLFMLLQCLFARSSNSLCYALMLLYLSLCLHLEKWKSFETPKKMWCACLSFRRKKNFHYLLIVYMCS